ncbi:MAG: hypothetical protein ACXWDF_12030 [Aeromicrobium sp.]
MDIVVHTSIDVNGHRGVQEIVAVSGRVENDNIESEQIFVRQGGSLVRGTGMPARRECFDQAGIDLDSLLLVGRWAD